MLRISPRHSNSPRCFARASGCRPRLPIVAGTAQLSRRSATRPGGSRLRSGKLADPAAQAEISLTLRRQTSRRACRRRQATNASPPLRYVLPPKRQSNLARARATTPGNEARRPDQMRRAPRRGWHGGPARLTVLVPARLGPRLASRSKPKSSYIQSRPIFRFS